MRYLLAAIVSITVLPRSFAQDYATVDPALKVISIDTDTKESFLCVRADTRGRLFVGGRDALFVYEPKLGGFAPRQLLYRFPPDSWVCDIETCGNDLYALTASALYVFSDGVRKRENLKPRKLVWGVPLGHAHQGFHALAWGPEGDLYFSMGAPLGSYGNADRPDHWGHWTFFCQRSPLTPNPSPPEGRGEKEAKVIYNGVGGVFRCKPDGSNLQVMARGLCNPRGLAFDRHWNLFSNDKQPGRLLHVTPHAYFGWPRGEPLQPMLNGKGGAAGQSYYDDTLLPGKYRHGLLVARPDLQVITRYSIEPRGASFQAANEETLLQGKNLACPLGVTVDRGGRIFAIIGYTEKKEAVITRSVMATVKCEIVMITAANAAPRNGGYEATGQSLDALWSELSDQSWQRRYRAHIELMRRGSEVWKAANKRLLTTKANDPALHHLIWLAARSQQGSLHLLPLVAHHDPLVRVQAIRALAEFPEQLRDEPILTQALLDEHSQVKHAAILGHYSPKVAWSRPIQQIILRDPAVSKDTYLRQAATLLLAEKATRQQLESLCAAADAPTRLAGVRAAGSRLTIPPVHKALAQHLPLANLRAEAVYVIQYADGKADLRQHGRIGSYTVAEHWKADMHTEEQELLFKLLRKMLGDTDEQVRMQSAFYLALLNDERSEPEIAWMKKNRQAPP